MASVRTRKWNKAPLPEDGTRIFVARYRPRFLRKGVEPWAEWHKELAPSRQLHAAWYGKGTAPIRFEEFTRRYLEEMQAQQGLIAALARRFAAGETLTFLCYCADASRCHRNLLKGLVEEAARTLRAGT